jgi:hypothetical protein
MAITVEIIHGVTGLTGTLKLYARGSDTIVNGAGDTMTEQTNRKGVYRATVDESLSGLYEAYFIDGSSNVLYTGIVDLADDADVHTVGDPSVGVDLESGLTAASVWAYASRTLTQSAAAVAAVMAGSDISVRRGDTTTISLTGIGSLVGRTKLWFTAKADIQDSDSLAVLQITESGGLVVLNGASPTTGQTATLTVTNEAEGNVTIVITALATAVLSPFTAGAYDIQMLVASGVATLTAANFAVTADVTKATT